MRILRDYGIGSGALLLVLGIVLGSMVTERRVCWSMGGLGLVLLVAGLALNREQVLAALKGRTARAAGASVGYTLTVVAVVLLVNFLSARHHKRFDLTANAAFSLSEQTIKVLESLPREVTVTAFYQEDPTRQKLDDLLAEYKYHSPKLSFRYVDPDKNPGEAKRYGITEYGTIVIESGKQESRVNAADEESLTNALIKVTTDRERVVYCTTGHGEHDLANGERSGLSALKGELEKQHYTVKPLVLSQGVPADASVVVIAGPQKAFLDAEVKMIRDYLDRGGHLFFMQDPGGDAGLGEVLAGYGASVRHDVIVDKVSRLFGGDYLVPLVPADGYDAVHPITKAFRFQTFYPLAASVEIKASLPEGVTATRLAQTSPLSWAQPDNGELKSGRLTLNEGAGVRGPLVVGAAFTKKVAAAAKPVEPAKDKPSPAPLEARLLVFGDSDFLSNAYFNASGNGDLALSGIAWLVEHEELVSIRPKTSLPSMLVLSRQQMFFYLWSIVAVAPLAVIVVGVGIWVRRKKL